MNNERTKGRQTERQTDRQNEITNGGRHHGRTTYIHKEWGGEERTEDRQTDIA